MSQIGSLSGREVVDTDDGVAFGQQRVTQMRAKKSGRAGDKNSL